MSSNNENTQSDTYVACLTPPGRGAIATIRVEGSDIERACCHVLQRLDSSRFDRLPQRTVFLALAGSNEQAAEKVVVSRPAPHAIEIHCHGGTAAVERLLRLLEQAGCRRISWQQWIHKTTADKVQAEAAIALAAARTRKTAAILLDQFNGALSHEIRQIAALLRSGSVDKAKAPLNRLVKWSEFGLHLVDGWSVVIAGEPNVGKSSLLNRLVGHKRAIVHVEPGTTRDVVTARTAIEGWPVELRDTAGLRETADPVEAAGVLLAQRQVQEADLVVLVLDVTRPWQSFLEQFQQQRPDCLVVFNKCDLVEPHTWPKFPGLVTSALTGHNIRCLEEQIAARLVPEAPTPGEAVPFTTRQVEAIRQAALLLDRSPQEAADLLLELLVEK